MVRFYSVPLNQYFSSRVKFNGRRCDLTKATEFPAQPQLSSNETLKYFVYYIVKFPAPLFVTESVTVRKEVIENLMF